MFVEDLSSQLSRVLCRKIESLEILDVARENKYSNYHDN